MPTALSPANPSIVTSVDMEPSRCKRVDYTRGACEPRVPADAASEWGKLCHNLAALYDKLAKHEAMRPNLEQTFNTPANNKTRVYYMWDFVGRTLLMLYHVPASLQGMSRSQQELWEDVSQRSVYAAMLITDGLPGMLDQMTEMSFPGTQGNHPAFDENTLAAARALAP